MVSEAPIKNGHAKTVPTARSGFASIGRDCWRLIELQARLAGIDLREFGARAVGPCCVIATALAIGFAAVGITLAGIGQVLAEQTELSLGTAQLIVAGVSLTFAGAALVMAVNKLRAAVAPLERSRDELIANVRSVVDALHKNDVSQPGRRHFTSAFQQGD